LNTIKTSFWVLLNNLCPCLNFRFIKRIKSNKLNNVIDFNFFSWIKMITFMFSNLHQMHLIRLYKMVQEFWRLHNSFQKGCNKKNFFWSFGWFFIFTKLKISGPNASQMCKNNHARKHVKLFIKTYVFIFYIFEFFSKYWYIITYTIEKSPPPYKLS
jgi:hypothetical protein